MSRSVPLFILSILLMAAARSIRLWRGKRLLLISVK
ncbi:unnamed protein product [Rhodiola kirilowii]